jgi:branched-chain amino acid transport system ATP-binding protein
VTERQESILEVDDVARHFGGVAALDGVDLGLSAGETRCVIGPNGAGKTTLINVLTGLIRPTRGKISFRGEDITGLPVSEIVHRGLVRSFQTPAVFPELAVERSLELAIDGTLSGGERREAVDRLLEEFHLEAKRGMLGRDLSHGEQKRLELGMVLGTDPQLVLLDEPTAGMSVNETEETANLLQRLCTGMTVVIVEHDMEFVRAIADRVTVLHRGRVLTEGSIEAVESDPRVRDVYLGTA